VFRAIALSSTKGGEWWRGDKKVGGAANPTLQSKTIDYGSKVNPSSLNKLKEIGILSNGDGRGRGGLKPDGEATGDLVTHARILGARRWLLRRCLNVPALTSEIVNTRPGARQSH